VRIPSVEAFNNPLKQNTRYALLVEILRNVQNQRCRPHILESHKIVNKQFTETTTIIMYSKIQLIVLLVTSVVVKDAVFAHEYDFSIDFSQSLIRRGHSDVEEFDAHGRQLYSSGSWSWANLLCKCKNINTFTLVFLIWFLTFRI
jgi:hypothetical protein